MKKSFLIIPLVAIVIYAIWSPNKDLTDNSIEVKATHLRKEDLKNLPKTVQEKVFDKNFSSNEYKKNLAAMSKESSFHHKLGENLYNVAFTKAFYSLEKVRLLEMAKEHLVYAKELGK